MHCVLGELKQSNRIQSRETMEISPYLSAIQCVYGQTPSDKYKELHSIATHIIVNESEKNEFINTDESKRVCPALLPYLRILVGNMLHQSDAVVKALKSDDVIVIKQALRARWFFNASNTLIRVDYFVENIMPYVSLRTRRKLIKTLANCLVTEPTKADEFFGSFSKLYDLEQVLPLIVACSENFIFEAILKLRINVPSRLLTVLYRRYPNLVIRYLQLGNNSNKTNMKDRKQHTISLVAYQAFLPLLVKNHTQVYVELYKRMLGFPYQRRKRLGNTRAEFFLKNAADTLIEKPEMFLHLLPLKLVSNKLSTQQFEAMYRNLLPDYENEFMFDHLKHYPEEKKLNLIREKYRKHYNTELPEVRALEFFDLRKLLPADEKEKICRKMIEPYLNRPDYYDHVYLLPPKEAIPLLKKLISKSSDKRLQYISAMIQSCEVYDSIDDLRDLLCYYNVQHKNEPAFVFLNFFDRLMNSFDLKTLPHTHWTILKEILQRAYVRGYFFTAPKVYEELFENAIHFYLKDCKTNAANEDSRYFLEQLVSAVLECYLEHNMKWKFISDCSELENDCLQKFLEVLPERYPVTHSAWDNFENKLSLVLYLVQTIHNFNVKNMYMVPSKKRYSESLTPTTMDSEGNEVRYTNFAIKSYKWLVKLMIDVLKSRDKITKKKTRTKYSRLRRILRKHDAQLYQMLVDNDSDLLYDCETSDAVVMLKQDSDKILSKWELYLKECKALLHGRSKSPKRFIKAMKWHQIIPIKFVEQCIYQIEDKDSILILGLLLEGDVFTKIAQVYLPKNKTLDLESGKPKQMYDMTMSLIKAVNYTNPPVALNVLYKFCQGDYVPLALQMLMIIGQRVPVNHTLEFAGKLVKNKTIAMKQLGIKLMFQVASKAESNMFLTKIWRTEKNESIRKVIMQMIFDLMQHSASLEIWELMKMCIHCLTADHVTALKRLNKIKFVDKNFVADLIVDLLKKLDEMPDDHMGVRSKAKFVSALTYSIDESIVHRLPEKLLLYITERVIFECNNNFIINLYILSDESKLEERLKNLIDFLKTVVNDYHRTIGNKARQCQMMIINGSDQSFDYVYEGFIGCFREFFKNLYEGLKDNEKKVVLKIRVVDEMLKFMTTSLRPLHLPYYYILMKIYKDSLDSETLEEFSIRFVESLKHFITEFGSEKILRTVAGVSELSLMRNSNDIFDIIEATMKVDQYLGSIFGILSLNRRCGHIAYSKKYHLLIKTWREINNDTVQALLNEVLISS